MYENEKRSSIIALQVIDLVVLREKMGHSIETELNSKSLFFENKVLGSKPCEFLN